MQTATLLLFAGALIISAGSPGPSIAALVSRVLTSGWVEMTLTMFVVLALIDVSYIVLAAKARVLLKNNRVIRLVNRISATIMGTAAVFIATR
jgi:threonine/homoserine/homoserine lactone efflux protein